VTGLRGIDHAHGLGIAPGGTGCFGLAELPGAQIDRATVLGVFREQFAALSRMHFEMSETARHFVMFDDLPWFTAELDRFLADPDAAARDRGFTAAR